MCGVYPGARENAAPGVRLFSRCSARTAARRSRGATTLGAARREIPLDEGGQQQAGGGIPPATNPPLVAKVPLATIVTYSLPAIAFGFSGGRFLRGGLLALRPGPGVFDLNLGKPQRAVFFQIELLFFRQAGDSLGSCQYAAHASQSAVSL